MNVRWADRWIGGACLGAMLIAACGLSLDPANEAAADGGPTMPSSSGQPAPGETASSSGSLSVPDAGGAADARPPTDATVLEDAGLACRRWDFVAGEVDAEEGDAGRHSFSQACGDVGMLECLNLDPQSGLNDCRDEPAGRGFCAIKIGAKNAQLVAGASFHLEAKTAAVARPILSSFVLTGTSRASAIRTHYDNGAVSGSAHMLAVDTGDAGDAGDWEWSEPYFLLSREELNRREVEARFPANLNNTARFDPVPARFSLTRQINGDVSFSLDDETIELDGGSEHPDMFLWLHGVINALHVEQLSIEICREPQ